MGSLHRSRWVTGPLAVFDIGLGAAALFFPAFYQSLMQAQSLSDDPAYLLQRTGTLWLSFALVEAMAFFRYTRFPEWVLMVATLRLIDVPADLVYWFRDNALSELGWVSLLVAPAFNLTVGVWLVKMYLRKGVDHGTDLDVPQRRASGATA